MLQNFGSKFVDENLIALLVPSVFVSKCNARTSYFRLGDCCYQSRKKIGSNL